MGKNLEAILFEKTWRKDEVFQLYKVILKKYRSTFKYLIYCDGKWKLDSIMCFR